MDEVWGEERFLLPSYPANQLVATFIFIFIELFSLSSNLHKKGWFVALVQPLTTSLIRFVGK